MKKRLLGSLLAALFVVGLMAPAAMADVIGTAVFNGVAHVGGDFVGDKCDKTGGTVRGKGLGLPDPTLVKHNTWAINAPFTLVGTNNEGQPGVYEGGFSACGYLSAPLNVSESDPSAPVGATCASTKGHHGSGNAFGVDILTGRQLKIKLYNLGWKAALGGTLLITGNYQEWDGDTKGKEGTIAAVAQVAPDASQPLGCLDKTQTLFTVAGTAELTQPELPVAKEDDEDDPLGEKKCGKSGLDCPGHGPRK